MPRYVGYIQVTEYYTVEVDAENAEDAFLKTREADGMNWRQHDPNDSQVDTYDVLPIDDAIEHRGYTPEDVND